MKKTTPFLLQTLRSKFNLFSVKPPMTVNGLNFQNAEYHPISIGHSVLIKRVVLWHHLNCPDSSPCYSCDYSLPWITNCDLFRQFPGIFAKCNAQVCDLENQDRDHLDVENWRLRCTWCFSIDSWNRFSSVFAETALADYRPLPPFARPILPDPIDWLIHSAFPAATHISWPPEIVTPPPTDPYWLSCVEKLKTSHLNLPHQ